MRPVRAVVRQAWERSWRIRVPGRIRCTIGTSSECPKRPFAGRPGPDRHCRPPWKSHPSRQPQNSLKISLFMRPLPNGCDTLTERAIRVLQPSVRHDRRRGGGGLSGAQVRQVTSADAGTRDGAADGTRCSDHAASAPMIPFPPTNPNTPHKSRTFLYPRSDGAYEDGETDEGIKKAWAERARRPPYSTHPCIKPSLRLG